MNTNYKKSDKLIFSLPDYVTGNLTETDIREQIEERLKNDKSFYAEYLKIKETFEYIKDAEIDAAPENYFSSLLPRIHERIEVNSTRKSILRYIIGSWKIAVPALTVILLILIFNKSDKVENINGVPGINHQAEIMSADSNVKEKTEVITNTGVEKTEINETARIPVKQKSVNTVNTENVDILNEQIFSETESEEEYYYEDEFLNMNESEQNELINNLKNTKF
jgi:anti-sigma-K factor RskA